MNSRLARNYESIRGRMLGAGERAARNKQEVSLVVVSKGRTVEQIASLYEMGHREFGENRARELADKVPQLPADIAWHFVGPLQTNKIRLVRPVVMLLHSLDRVDLARSWMKPDGPAPPALLQVNIGREPQKHGFDPDDVIKSANEVVAIGVSLGGLMAIPPLSQEPDDSRPYFRALSQMSAQLRRIHPEARALSMGMTDDFEVAIEEGATLIRVGRAIFEPTSD